MATIRLASQYIEILADSKDHDFVRLLSTCTGIFKVRKRDTYRCSVRKLPEVLKVLRNVTNASMLTGIALEAYNAEMLRRERTDLLKKLGPDMTSEWLWPHQCLGIELAQLNSRYNFFYDTRTGKTLMALKIMYDRLRSGENKRCLVICPPNIIRAWLKDAEDMFPELKIAAFYGEAAQCNAALHKPAHIVIWATNHVANNIDLLKAANFDTCFFDESSKMKNYKTGISEAAVELSQHIKSWYNLSATPAPNCEAEYYIQMKVIDPYIFNPTRGLFVSRYFDNNSRNVNYEKLAIKANMYDEFMGILEDYSIYVDQAVMPGAGKKWHEVRYELTNTTKEIYDEMRNEKYAQVKGTIITSDFAAAVRSKLNQIASGFLLDTEAIKSNKIMRILKLDEEKKQEAVRLDDTARIVALKELLTTFGNQKVVIWANFKEEFAMIEQLLGTKAAYLNGDSNLDYKEQSIYTDFKKGALQYLVCHPLSVGMGINLTESHIAVYYSVNDSWEAFKQSSERIYGHISVQPNECQYYVIIANGTVNDLIYDNVKNKRDVSTGLLYHLQGSFCNDNKRATDY